MTNKDKALNKLNSVILIPDDDYMVFLDDAKKCINIASKPDWFYPSKGEFPENYMEVWVEYIDDNKIRTNLKNFYISDKDWWINNIKAWTYLPTYKED